MKSILFFILVTSVAPVSIISCNNRSTGTQEKMPDSTITTFNESSDTQHSDTLSSFPTAPSCDSLFEAALSGMKNEVIEIIDKGTDVNTKDEDGRTVLMYASFNGHSELINNLVLRGAKVNLQDINGRTALMLASSGPFPDAVKILLDHGADPNIIDKAEHYSALMYAASEGQLEVVKILLKYNADPYLKDIDGDDALTFAKNNGHRNVAELLSVYPR
ncbi:MAG TPA: ankyrin repeat domain-containing protein [Bacteroidales bacterium]|nr:ankyrin repeat domain-containing protein [Bacteroidales bacterium]